MNAKQLRELVIRPTLQYLSPAIPYSETATELLMMTAAHESHLGEYIAQVGGPALGIYQMEPATENDIWDNYLEYNRQLGVGIYVLSMAPTLKNASLAEREGADLIYSLPYATAMARVHYFRVPEALPEGSLQNEETIRKLAAYAKKYYNTELGKATEEDYYEAYMRLCR